MNNQNPLQPPNEQDSAKALEEQILAERFSIWIKSDHTKLVIKALTNLKDSRLMDAVEKARTNTNKDLALTLLNEAGGIIEAIKCLQNLTTTKKYSELNK